MAVCSLTKDILKSNVCGYSLKQIVDLYLANYADVLSTTIGAPADGTGVEVKTITLAENAKFYHIEPNKDSASFTDTLQVGDAGSKYRQTEISWSIGGVYDAQMADVLDALSLGRYVVVAKVSDGSYIMFGRITPLESNAASLEGSADATGFSGIQVTFQNNSVESPLSLSAEAVKTVLGQE